MNEVTGKLINKADIFVSDSGTFTKQEIVLALVNGEYTNVAVLEGVQDMVQTLAGFNIGDEVKCTFFFNGRNQEYKGRYYNSLKINSIELVNKSQSTQPDNQPVYHQPEAAPPQAVAPPVMPPMDADVVAGGALEDDVPFNKLGDFEQ